jgi:hypothetical protein
MRGLSLSLKGKGLICDWISNYKGLGVKSIKGLDCRLISRKVRGLIAKCQGKSITRRIIFLKKTLWLSPWGRGPWVMVPAHGPWWTGLLTPSPASNPGPPIRIQWPEKRRLGSDSHGWRSCHRVTGMVVRWLGARCE